MTAFPRRRWLLGASALSAALLLPGCGSIPFLGRRHEPGSCLPPSEEIPDEVHETVPDGVRAGVTEPSPDRRFLTSGFAVSPDGTLLAACESYDRWALDLADTYGLILWDTASGEVIQRISAPAQGAIAWHPDGTRLAVADGRHITIVDVEGELQWNLIGHELPRGRVANVLDVAYSPEGTQLASTSTDGTVRLWDMSGQQCAAGHILAPGRRSEARVSYSPDGSVLAVGATATWGEGDADNPPELWDPASGDGRTVLRDVHGIVFGIGHSGDGSLLALTHEPDSLTVIDPDGTMSEGPVTASTQFAELAVGSGSRVAIHSGEGELMIWDRATGDQMLLEDVSLDRMCWSPDESVLYALHHESGAAAWDGQDWRQFELP